MFCRKCGYDLPEDSSFCAKCGEQILPSSPPPQQIQQAQKSAPPPKQNKTHSAPEDAPKTFKERVLFLFKFSGRISRKTFIINFLVVLAAQVILTLAVIATDGSVLCTLFGFCVLLTVIPHLALGVRRMRDAGIPLLLIPIGFGVMVYCNIEANHYIEQFRVIANNTPARGEIDTNLRLQAVSYFDTARNFRMAATFIPLIFSGALLILPSRKRKNKIGAKP